MPITRTARIFGSGPLGLAVSLILLGVAFWIDGQIDPPELMESVGARVTIFTLSAVIAFVIVLWSLKSLPATDRGNRLCTSGAFEHVRHPLYAAFLSIFNFGLAVYLNSWVFVVWAIILHPLWHFVIRYEERLMIELFGEPYRDYQKKTGRFLPRLRVRP